jgi:DNA-binding transcriptional MerR regulator/DNA gyrase inhibitor GyrI
MSELIAINVLSAKINISSRTLRHWEDAGLFKSTRDPQSGWRMYDEETINNIRIIELLRRLDLSIQDIKKVLEHKSVDELIAALRKQHDKLMKSAADVDKQRIVILEIIDKIQNRQAAPLSLLDSIENILVPVKINRTQKQITASKNNKEITDMSIFDLNNDYEYVITTLPPMRTAACHHHGLEPENPDPALTWVKENNLLGTARFFGFNTEPYPTKDNPEFGYDFCVSIPENIIIPDYLYEKRLPGGIYAAFICEGIHVGEMWAKIQQGLNNPEWEWAYDNERDALEEHTGFGVAGGKVKITVLIPVKKKK